MSIPSSGSSTCRSASSTSSSVGTATRLAEVPLLGASLDQPHLFAPVAGEEVDPVDEAHPVAARAHHERVRAGGIGEVADAAEELAVRDPGRGDDHLLRREIVDREHTLDVVDPVRARVLDLGTPRRPELSLQLAAEAAQRSRREYRLARPADPDREVVVRAADRGGDRREHVTVLNQLDPRAGRPDLLDEIVMAGPGAGGCRGGARPA